MQASTAKTGTKPAAQGRVQLQSTNTQNDGMQSLVDKVN